MQLGVQAGGSQLLICEQTTWSVADEFSWNADGGGVSGLDHNLPLLHSLRGDRKRGDLGGIVTEGAGPFAPLTSPGKWVTPSGDPSYLDSTMRLPQLEL